jgi:hypothetical protein
MFDDLVCKSVVLGRDDNNTNIGIVLSPYKECLMELLRCGMKRGTVS